MLSFREASRISAVTQRMIQSSLIGHEKRWAALARAFERGIVPQSLLISGAPGVGKWTLARRYSQLLLCPHSLEPEQRDAQGLPAPCGKCRVCHQVEIESFPDFKVYRPLVSAVKDEKDWVTAPRFMEGAILTVEVARRFGQEAMMKPLVGPRKVMLMRSAERMNDEAQNALLKTFEEPVPGLSIILLCDNPHGLLPTVLSRCWHLPLGLASDAAIAEWLRADFDATDKQTEAATRVAAGRPGAAWRELQRMQGESSASESRFVQAGVLVDRILKSQPVGALGLTEEALRLAREWWSEDAEELEGKAAKKGDAKATRSALARFLDELSHAYRARWSDGVEADANADAYACGLDLIRKTRHYILRNANANLALDVLFGRLISLHRAER